MRRLNRFLEYLLWYEEHRERWVAVPIVREGDLLLDTDYGESVMLDIKD
jgi:hypothetical protein